MRRRLFPVVAAMLLALAFSGAAHAVKPDEMLADPALEARARALSAELRCLICQSQSINVYLPADIDKWDLHMLHWTAWKKGLKSLYYCRSKSISRAAFVGQQGEKPASAEALTTPVRADYEECLACQ